MKACIKCGATDRYPCGRCRLCARARADGYVLAPPAKRAEDAQRAKQLLEQCPMTRAKLEFSLGITQPRVSEILRVIGARVVGKEPPPGKGSPAPIYGFGEHQAAPAVRPIGRVSSVWQLGAL